MNSFTSLGKKKSYCLFFFYQPSGYSLFKRKEEALLSDHMGHDPFFITVNGIFVSSKRAGPGAEVASFELRGAMSSELYLKEKLA